ncbi:PhzF family phenazine biosynthesis protein [Microbulbifer salipaludis]|uniref:PhzF family phenazine biosynthesis protein n=1 Tax=Microbulbifer salipaludis TaxID=187980 RepID=A0ABS3E495_9GAMM|nr:PhzF family phenazine biosynthesis protein [Microbulbifer salipaludis]MBN8430126.1 PhzF family phenazine biosynthesis protein [Microbulbifer salipaludis]
MQLPIYQADAFTSALFRGNPAAYVPLTRWLDDQQLQQIAAENNLAETAFTVPAGHGFELRWFTPGEEVPLCGHATLATAHLLWSELGFIDDEIHFFTRSGKLIVRREREGEGERLALDFPVQNIQPISLGEEYTDALGVAPLSAMEVAGSNDQLLVEFASADIVANLEPDMRAVARLPYKGVICTAPGDGFDCDFVSRFFAPAIGIDEDPVTGSAHTYMTPFWAAKLDKPALKARQISARGGELDCELNGERVIMRGRAITYLRGQITL